MLAFLYAPALLLIYYLVVWFLRGRDPKPGPVVPRYTPPPGLTPAAARYLQLNGTDGRSLAALLVDLALRKRITIEPQDGKYRVRFVNSPVPLDTLPPEEKIAMELLLAWNTPTTADPVTLDMSYVPRNSGLVSGIEGALRKQYDGVFYSHNYGFIAGGVLATCLWAVAMALITPNRDGSLVFLTVWFLFTNFILGIIFAARVVPALKSAYRVRMATQNLAYTILVLAAFLGMSGFVAFHMARQSSPQFIAALCCALVINVTFGSIMKTLTSKGREMMDYLAGYRQYLVSVESDRMNRMNAPTTPLALLNEHLPYAIALDVKENWGDHFSDAFFTATASQG